LLTLADAQIAQSPRTPDRVDRALAALEAAARIGVEPPFELQWRVARACFHLSEMVSSSSASEAYALRGVTHGEQAVALSGERVEGHYYLALNMVKSVEASAEVTKLGPMMEVAQRAVTIDPSFDDAGPFRLVGKVYMVAPEWPASVGDRDKAVEILKKAVATAATPMNRLFLGQALYHIDEYDKAAPHVRRALKEGIKTGLPDRWLDEARDYLHRMGVGE
jgi:tetratricopeptide (TPR) repeat protein